MVAAWPAVRRCSSPGPDRVAAPSSTDTTVGDAVSPAAMAIRPGPAIATLPRGVWIDHVSPSARSRGRSMSLPWGRVARRPFASRLTISISVPPSNPIRLDDNSSSARAFGSVQNALPEAMGKLADAGTHCVSPAVWYDTVPVARANRPTRVGGSGWAGSTAELSGCPESGPCCAAAGSRVALPPSSKIAAAVAAVKRNCGVWVRMASGPLV